MLSSFCAKRPGRSAGILLKLPNRFRLGLLGCVSHFVFIAGQLVCILQTVARFNSQLKGPVLIGVKIRKLGPQFRQLTLHLQRGLLLPDGLHLVLILTQLLLERSQLLTEAGDDIRLHAKPAGLGFNLLFTLKLIQRGHVGIDIREAVSLGYTLQVLCLLLQLCGTLLQLVVIQPLLYPGRSFFV
ncbi:hypothetical protein D3C73_1016830 [compost metagenome]